MASQYQNFDVESQSEPQRQEEKGQITLFNERLGFIRKVYSILLSQILFTILFVWIAVRNPLVLAYQLNNMFLFYSLLVLEIVILVALMCTSYGRIAPTNYILLGIFTLAESYLVSMICAMTSPDIVVMAAIFTGVIFSALTTYAFRTKTDFTIAGGALYMFGMGLTTFGFLLFFTDNKFLHLVYGFFGSIFFGLYLIWDTQMIIGQSSFKYSIDDYVIAAISLYLDIIGLFLEILRMFRSQQ